MKVIYQIILIVLIFFLLFIVKDDLKYAYDNNSSGSGNTGIIYNIKNILLSGINKIENVVLVDSDKSAEKIKPASKINVSGPLRVINDLISLNNKSIKLTKENVIALTNQNRYENGKLLPLTENSKLSFSAEKKLQDMFMKQYFEHISPSGVGVGDLADQVSYEYIVIGENLAMGNFKDDKALVDAWMASPGHRANILNPKYTEIGVAVGEGKFEGKDVWMAVQHFGLPKSTCPKIDEVLHGVINIDQDQIKSISNDLATLHKKIDSGVVYDGQTTIEQIDKYNSTVTIYNQLITEVKTKITQYNNQVTAFNSCLSNNT